jgi:DNA-binding CsgD family transcriptional regulator
MPDRGTAVVRLLPTTELSIVDSKAPPLSQRVSAPVLVGRDDDFRVLAAALQRADRGDLATVLVGGDAGVGKSRLVTAFAARAATHGATTLIGGCPPLAEGPIPGGPVMDMLRRLPTGPAVDSVVDSLPRSVRARLVPFLPDRHGGTATAAGTPDQPRLFYALLSLFERLAATGPLVLVFEDLHWADRWTRDLFGFLGGVSRPGRLLLIGTYRLDELPHSDPLHRLLGEVARAGAERLCLRPFTRDETARQVAGILGAPADEDLITRIFARSEGNPFVTEELLAAGADGPVPERLHDLLRVRIRQLPDDVQRLLRVVAVSGRRVGHRVLAEVVSGTEDALQIALRAAVDHHILVADGDGYAFRHALIAEAVAADILPGERSRLHRAYATVLAAHRRTGPVGDDITIAAHIAHHWWGAGDVPKALAGCVAAGLAAARIGAPGDARRHFERALALWPDVPAAPDSAGMDLVDLHRHAAEAVHADGDTDTAIALTRAALARLDPAGDAPRVALLYERLGWYLLTGAHPDVETLAAQQAAVDLTPDGSAARARVMGTQARVLTVAKRHRESRRWATGALRVARRLGRRHEEAEALALVGQNLVAIGDTDRGMDFSRRALAQVRTLDGAGDGSTWLYGSVAVALAEAGRYAEALDVAAEGAAVARRHGVERTRGAFLVAISADMLFCLGRWPELARLVDDAVDPCWPIDAAALPLALAQLHTAQGRFADAGRQLADARRAFGSAGFAASRARFHVLAAEHHLWQDHAAAAAAVVDDAWRSVGDVDDGLLLTRLASAGLRARADLRAAPGSVIVDGVPVEELLERMRAVSPTPAIAAHAATAEAELGRLMGTDDAEGWAVAASAWARLQCPYPAAYARWRQGEALLATRGRSRAARAILADAHGTASTLDARPLRGKIEAAARRARVTLDRVPAGPRAAAVPAPAAAHGLTRREVDVLRLLGSGYTNRQIARTLFISYNTVGVHVSRILTKLGAANRAEAATMALRMGISEDHAAS